MNNIKENSEWIFWTTLVVSFVLLEHNGTEPLFLIAYAFIPLLVLIFYFKRSFWTVVFYLLLIGFLGRYTRYFRGVYSSDVLPTINDFIGYFVHGKNVYGELVYARTGLIPFVYLPFTIYWYLPARILNIDFRFFEMIVSAFVPIVFFLSTWTVKNKWKVLPVLSVISLTPFLLDLAADGSNDNSAIFLLLTSIAFLAFSRVRKSAKLAMLSAIFLGFAITFKHYSFFYLLFFVPFAFKNENFLSISFKKYFLVVLLIFVIIALPFFLRSPIGFLKSFVYVEVSNQANHPIWGWNIWLALKQLFNFVPNIQLVWLTRTFAVIVTVASSFLFLKINKFNKVFVAASITILVYLIFSQWTTYAYFTFLVPLLCLSAFDDL
ncbi:MAG: hypothetical protein M1450_05490 [Patescibacteria group bacterium]|nr:hypothetical protein [Patescibacteria group bacterium]